MQSSTIVLLINDDARAVEGRYEENGKTSVFKTLDQSVKKGDICVVESSTRWGFTTVKITDVDVEVNFDHTIDVGWVVQRVDTDAHEVLLEEEKAAIETVQAAERRRKKEELRQTLFADHQEQIKALALSKTGDDSVAE